jgi:hypothetical protein
VCVSVCVGGGLESRRGAPDPPAWIETNVLLCFPRARWGRRGPRGPQGPTGPRQVDHPYGASRERPRGSPPAEAHGSTSQNSSLSRINSKMYFLWTFSALNKLQGIKGDRGPAGTNGDKGEKVGPQPPIGLIHLSVNIPVNLWSHHFLLFNGIHTAVQLKVVSLSVFTGPPRATRTPGGRWPSRQCCTLHFRLVLMGSMGHWGWYYTILSMGIGDDTRWLADS